MAPKNWVVFKAGKPTGNLDITTPLNKDATIPSFIKKAAVT
jgi:hypothetical protein